MSHRRRRPLRLRRHAVQVDTQAGGGGGAWRTETGPRVGDPVLRVGARGVLSNGLYHLALIASWPVFMLAVAAVYFGLNLVFAVLYFLQPGAVANAQPGSFADVYSFSVETLATIGYGNFYPATRYAQTVMSLEALAGILIVAVLTGLIFARVSRPTAKVVFSAVAVITPHDGVPTLMVRAANARRNQILQAQVQISLVRNLRTAEGEWMRRFYDMRLARDRTPLFALSFTMMHVIDETSPLHGVTRAQMEADQYELVVMISGVDETMAQTVHARTSYSVADIRFGHRFVDIFGLTPEGRRAVDFRRFHETEADAGRDAVEDALDDARASAGAG